MCHMDVVLFIIFLSIWMGKIDGYLMTLIAYEGENVTVHCYPGAVKLTWQYDVTIDGNKETHTIVQYQKGNPIYNTPVYNNPWNTGRAFLNTSNGDLTLSNLHLSDDRAYECHAHITSEEDPNTALNTVHIYVRPIQVILSPVPLRVPENTALTLTCTVPRVKVTVDKIEWRKNGKVFAAQPNSDLVKSLNSDGTFHQVGNVTLQVSNSPRIMCVVYGHDRMLLDEILIHTGDHQETSQEITVTEGSTSSLQCLSPILLDSGVTWFKGQGLSGSMVAAFKQDDSNLNPALFGYPLDVTRAAVLSTSGTLVIHNVSLVDDGWYTCQQGNTWAYRHIQVHVPPVRMEIKHSVLNNKLVLECSIPRVKPKLQSQDFYWSSPSSSGEVHMEGTSTLDSRPNEDGTVSQTIVSIIPLELVPEGTTWKCAAHTMGTIYIQSIKVDLSGDQEYKAGYVEEDELTMIILAVLLSLVLLAILILLTLYLKSRQLLCWKQEKTIWAKRYEEPGDKGHPASTSSVHAPHPILSQHMSYSNPSYQTSASQEYADRPPPTPTRPDLNLTKISKDDEVYIDLLPANEDM